MGSGLPTGINCAWKHLSTSTQCDNRHSNEAPLLCASPLSRSQVCWRSNSDDVSEPCSPSEKFAEKQIVQHPSNRCWWGEGKAENASGGQMSCSLCHLSTYQTPLWRNFSKSLVKLWTNVLTLQRNSCSLERIIVM